MIVDHVSFGGQLTKLFEHAVGEPGGGDLHIEFGPVHLVLAKRDNRRYGVGAQRQHLALDAMGGATFTELEHHVLDAADGFRQIGLIEM